MNIRPIRTDQNYRTALKALSPLFDKEPEPGTPEGDYFEVMLTLVEAYEAKHFPVDLATLSSSGWSNRGWLTASDPASDQFDPASEKVRNA